MLPLVITNGLIDSFNPCAIGVLLIYISILLGTNSPRSFILTFGGFYILATFVTYFLIGLGILQVIHLFGIPHFFGWVAAVLVLFIGVFYIKDYYLPAWQIPVVSPFLSRCRMITWNKKLTIFSAIALGVLIGLCEFPCSGGIYLATVAMLSLRETFWQGVLYLVVYNMMFILPLVIIFVLATNKGAWANIKGWQSKTAGKAKLISGALMTLLGILLLVWLTLTVT
ncbi:MAG TPA: cytochrome c biogenesis protein CcdA [Candidatus Nanoarchaeia archaeon]